jgi:hypothetical protein
MIGGLYSWFERQLVRLMAQRIADELEAASGQKVAVPPRLLLGIEEESEPKPKKARKEAK